tara:strand:- start:152 stop:673 length:522 start_codon:yes stop_codon:yes gene_type:complete
MIDEKAEFKSINIAVLTISDTRNKDTDKSGSYLYNVILEKKHFCPFHEVIKDDVDLITKNILDLSHKNEIHVIITTGGTGLTGRDNTIDAVKSIADLEIPGFGELFRNISYKKIGTSAIQSRSSAFLINNTYIFCLPGSSSAVKDAWSEILFYQLDIRHKPCNFIELIPRLDE